VLPVRGGLAADLEAAGIEVLVRPLAVMRRSVMSPRGVSRVGAAWAADAGGLGRLARSRGVALVHTNTSVTLGGAAAARLAGVPHVWHVREIYAGFERWWPAYRRLLSTADALPCVSRAACLQFDGAPPAMVVHDGPAVDLTVPPRAVARAALGLPEGATVVAVLGRISGWKGQDVAIQALAAPALRDRPEVLLALAGAARRGDERHVRRLHELAAALGVADRVHHLGFCEHPATVYGAADVVAVPSTQPDPFPSAALEAATAGCCVVGAAHGGIPELLRDGRTGVLVAPRDPLALAAALAALAGAPQRRAKPGAAAAADVRARFSTRAMLDAIEGLYATLLGGRRPAI
jgi:glycosyltransferase involved in cell wall biosynthesis